LDFAGLNHAMCDWLNICETTNQNIEKIRFHENGMSAMLASLPSQKSADRKFAASKGGDKRPNKIIPIN